MTGNYIENHFDEIIGHESEIEARLVDADCTVDVLKADNENITIKGTCGGKANDIVTLKNCILVAD